MRRRYFPQMVLITQLILDYFTVVVSFMGGYYMYHFLLQAFDLGVGVQPISIYRNLAFGAGFLFLIIFERFGLYSRKVGVLNVAEIKRILQSMLIGSLVLFSLSFLLRPVADAPDLMTMGSRVINHDVNMIEKGPLLYSRLILLYSLTILLFVLNIQRSLVNRILMTLHVKGPGLHRVLIYGAGDVGRQLQRRLFENPRIGMKPIGYVDDDLNKVGEIVEGIVDKTDTSIKVLGNGLQLEELICGWDIHEVIIAIPNASTSRIYEIINDSIRSGVRFSFVPNLFDMFIQQVRFEEIDGIPLLRMKSQRSSFIYLVAKRIFDVVFSTLCLIITFPLIPIIVMAIKFNSKGSVLFTQERVGKDGKLFEIYKFRTMKVSANNYETSPKDCRDPRITMAGRFLRKFNLDEIPQFINVLRGDMSIVGPRPEMPFVVDEYTPLQRQRLKVRPGITGIWQISAARSTRIHDNLDYDFYYAENQSFLLDMVIIFKTFMASFRGKGV